MKRTAGQSLYIVTWVVFILFLRDTAFGLDWVTKHSDGYITRNHDKALGSG